MYSQLNPSGPLLIPGYTLAPTGGKVAYVHSSGGGGLSELPSGIADVIYKDINTAMNTLRDNRGDLIVCLPGHSESVATATALSNIKAGVTVMSEGNGDERATFNWTAAASQWAISKANVKFVNCRLNFAATAATTVTLAIDVTAVRFNLVNCEIILAAAGGSQKAAIGVRYSTGSDKSHVENCEIFGAPDGAFTDGFLVNAAIDRFMFRNNYGSAGPAGANGVLRFAAAATNIIVDGNTIENTLAGANSTAVFVGFAGITGQFPWNSLSVQNNGTAASQGIITMGNARANQTFTSDEPGKSGVLSPAVVAT